MNKHTITQSVNTNSTGSVESMPISVLKVGSWNNIDRLSFKAFQVPERAISNVNAWDD